MEDDVEQEEDTPVDHGEACGVLLELVGSEVVLLGEEPTCN
jgi:hypothetical protein